MKLEDIVELYGEQFFLHFIDDNFFRGCQKSIYHHLRGTSKWPQIKFSFATRSDQVLRGEAYVKNMASLGAVTIELGIENGSQRVLERYNKKLR